MTDPAIRSGPMLVVAAALVDQEGRVLVQQRPAHKQHGGLWEFPGGKVEAGEGPEQALARELAEELGIGVAPADALPVAFASRAADGVPLLLLLYAVRRWSGEPRALDASALAWQSPAAIVRLPMPPADRDLALGLAQRPPLDHADPATSLFDMRVINLGS